MAKSKEANQKRKTREQTPNEKQLASLLKGLENVERDKWPAETKAKIEVLKEEIKQANFVRLANRRVPRILSALKGISALSAKGNYSYTAEQAGAIITAIGNALEKVANAFTNVVEANNSFHL